MERFLIIRSIGRGCQASRREGGIIHHQEGLYRAILQVIVNVIDRGMPLDTSVAAPRIFALGDVLVLNAAFPATLSADMRERGWQVKRGEQDFRQHLGIVQAVGYDPRTGVFSGAADTAYDGTASGPPK